MKVGILGPVITSAYFGGVAVFDEAKNKVTNGLYFFNETDLYDFLESYSS